MKIDFKRDNYREARGAHSRFLNLFCRVCKNNILIYQKDGPGNLRRLYFDRIFYPKRLVNLQNRSLKSVSILRCPKCKEDLGTPYFYKKENRKAFKLYQDALKKQVISLKKFEELIEN